LLLDTADEVLRTAGVSGNKVRALKDLAAKTLDGTVPTHAAIRKMTDAEIVERLTAVRGIGPWTVEMLLIFRMGRPDVLPATDYGVRKGFALTFQRVPKTRPLAAEDLPQPEVLLKRGKRWTPFRSVASWYLWRACDLAKGTAPTGRAKIE
jgi:DNA-3-methyladenine glycosylase II